MKIKTDYKISYKKMNPFDLASLLKEELNPYSLELNKVYVYDMEEVLLMDIQVKPSFENKTYFFGLIKKIEPVFKVTVSIAKKFYSEDYNSIETVPLDKFIQGLHKSNLFCVNVKNNIKLIDGVR